MPRDAAYSLAQGGETRSVSFSLTEEDFTAFERAAKYRLSRPAVPIRFPRARRRRRAEWEAKLLLFALGAFVAFQVAPSELQERIHSLFRLVPAFFIGIAVGVAAVLGPFLAWIFVWQGSSARRERFRQSRRQALRMRRTIRISAACVEYECDDGLSTTLTKWAGVEEIATANGLLLFFTGVLVAFVIPDRAFADEAERAEFVGLARSYHEQYGPRKTSAVGTVPGPT